MSKEKITIEREMGAGSIALIWTTISSPGGLAKWLADDVQQQGQQLTFVWGPLWSHHDIRTATILEIVKNEHIQFRWDDEEEDTYIRIKIAQSDLTKEIHITVTDFASEEDVEALQRLWQDSLQRLHHITGL